MHRFFHGGNKTENGSDDARPCTPLVRQRAVTVLYRLTYLLTVKLGPQLEYLATPCSSPTKNTHITDDRTTRRRHLVTTDWVSALSTR